MNKIKYTLLISALFAMMAFSYACAAEDSSEASSDGGSNTLQQVLDRGMLKCGVNDNLAGFGVVAADGSFSGFDIDFCKAVAAAILGDSGKVEYTPTTASNRFEALGSGEIDLLIRNTTWTASRDRELKQDFTAATFYDGQGMMVYVDSGYNSIDDMEGATICVLQGTTTELNLDDRFTGTGMSYTPLTFETNDPLQAAFEEKRCDGWTTDKSGLASKRASFPGSAGGPEALKVLPETLSKEPLGPLTRDNDSEFYDVVQWVVFGMMQAEESGINSGNVSSIASNPPNPGVARLLGSSFEGGEVQDFSFGIPKDFMQKVISQVGNYGEVYDRHLVPLGLERAGSLNAMWTEGGLIYAPPFR
ncbi:MAG: amino acid ABC transporter substrate-binding protein [Dehalococcoidia bacterium]|tara:strand:+ start:2125 stop:3207 length:1083 start_codon:yes stop_codon:yes gene_type:complete